MDDNLIFVAIIFHLFQITIWYYFMMRVHPNYFSAEKFIVSYYIFYTAVIPFLFFMVHEYVFSNANNFWIRRKDFTLNNYFEFINLNIIGSCSVALGYLISRRMAFSRFKVTRGRLRVYVNLLTIVSIFSMCLTAIHIVKTGGFLNAFAQSAVFRAHGVELPLGQLSKFQPLVVWCSFLLHPFKLKRNYFFIFGALLFLVLDASRTNFAFYLFAFFIYSLNTKQNFKLRYLVYPLILAILLAVYGNALTDAIAGIESSYDFKWVSVLISQFLPTFTNMLNIGAFVEDVGFSYYSDLFTIFNVVIDGMNDQKTWQQFTIYYLGYYGSVGMQLDLFSNSYAQAGYIGLVSHGLFYGCMFGSVIAILRRSFKAEEKRFFIAIEIMLSFFAGSLFVWGSVDSAVFYGNLKFIVPLALIFVIFWRRVSFV